ncbi:hypothetical protein IWW45_006147, partial [Coemansia sp. RSA 485]
MNHGIEDPESVLPTQKRQRTEASGSGSVDISVTGLKATDNIGLITPPQDAALIPNSQGHHHDDFAPNQGPSLVSSPLPQSPMSATSTRSRPKNYRCSQCPKTFTRPCRLEEHLRAHT